jgi:hypothetical protein
MPSVLERLSVLTDEVSANFVTLETRYTPPGGTPMQGTEQTLAGLKKILS